MSEQRHPGKRLRRASPGLIIGIVILLLVGLWGLLAAILTYNRQATLTAAEVSAGNLAQAFEAHVLRTVKAVDHVLLILRKDWQHGAAMFFEEVRALQDVYEPDLLLQVAVIGPDGRLLVSNLQSFDQAQAVDLSDREHFRAHLHSRDDRLFISKPLHGRVSGQTTIQFTRRITNPRGEFGGVLVVSLSPDYFGDFFSTIDVGKLGAITLAGLDGVIRARASRASDADKAHRLLATDCPCFHDVAYQGIYRNICSVDGIERIVAYRRLDDYPLVVQVGLASEEVLERHYGWRRSLILWTATLSVLLLLAAVALARSLRVQECYRSSLQREARRLEAANASLAKSETKLRFANDRLRLLNHIALLRGDSARQRIQTALQLGAEHLGVEFGFIGRTDGSEIVLEQCIGPATASVREGARLAYDRSYCARTIALGDALAISNTGKARDPALPERPAIDLGCYIGVPLTLRGTPYGTLCFGSNAPYPRAFDNNDLEFMRLLGRWASDLLSKEATEAELRRLATTDPLTGVSNRRHFKQVAECEIARARRYCRPLSLVMFDIDHFKRINDRFGHQAGDGALVALTRTCANTLRDSDVLGRLGGEEFAVLLTETDTVGALTIAERLRQTVAALTVPVGEDIIRFTISLGISELESEETLDDLLRRADQALYRAKQQGRNRAVNA